MIFKHFFIEMLERSTNRNCPVISVTNSNDGTGMPNIMDALFCKTFNISVGSIVHILLYFNGKCNKTIFYPCNFQESYQTAYLQDDKRNDLIHTVSHWQSKYVPAELVYCSTTTTWHGTGHQLAYKT